MKKKLLEPGAVRDAICSAISVTGLSATQAFLTFAGVLPLSLPDGCKIAFLPDIHCPAHHHRLMWAIKQFLSVFHPHLIIFTGDLADIFALSRHPKQLRICMSPQKELDQTRQLADELMEAAGCYWAFVIPGNHEDRIYRFLQDLAPTLGGVLNPATREPLSFHSLMGYTPDDPITFVYGTEERAGVEGGLLLNNDLGVHHGIFIRPKAGASPLADMDRYLQSVVHGHTHRMGMVSRDITPSEELPTGVLRGYELGHLVDMDHSYMAYARQMWPNWHPGFGVGLVHNGAVHLQPVPIQPVNGTHGHSRLGFVWDGRVYTESDR
jgi:predicted MPP superfamily phosphohydrolase